MAGPFFVYLRAGFDRPRRIARPLAPRTRVEPGAGKTGQFERQQAVARRHARPAVEDGFVRPCAGQSGGQPRAQGIRRAEHPVFVDVLHEVVVDRTGDVSRDTVNRLDFAAIAFGRPRIDAARRSARRQSRDLLDSATMSARGEPANVRAGRVSRPDAVGRCRRSIARTRRRARPPRGGPSSGATTTAGSRTCRCPDRRPRPERRRRCRSRRSVRTSAAGSGSGWRPLCPDTGPERSDSRWAYTAPGMCRATYSRAPQPASST